MVKEEDKFIEWMNMSPEDRRKYNGYAGFLKNELFKDNNMFMIENKARLERRLVKEKNFRKRKKMKINKNGGKNE